MVAQVQLSKPQPDGSTLRDHLRAAAAVGAAPDARLMAAPPAAMAALWEAFCALGQGFGPADVLAWQALHGVTLSPWEAETLLIMGRVSRH